MRKVQVLLAALIILISVSSCSVFDYLFKTKYQVLGEALVKSSGKGLEKQETAANASMSKNAIEKLVKAAFSRETGTLENGLTYAVSEPVTKYTSVKKWDDKAFADAYKDDGTKYTEPPAKDDPNGPGLWEITMSIRCQVTTKFENYPSAGWTFSGDITHSAT
jgi:hypothetical protein